MKKWKYDKIEDVLKESMIFENIEYKDRFFASDCIDKGLVCNINTLFCILDDMKNGLSYDELTRLHEVMEKAKSSWNYIAKGLLNMSDIDRYKKEFERFYKNAET